MLYLLHFSSFNYGYVFNGLFFLLQENEQASQVYKSKDLQVKKKTQNNQHPSYDILLCSSPFKTNCF